jgi:glyoxylase-like metal-dependent hydrolase (beta-lactamase superfamily II)
MTVADASPADWTAPGAFEVLPDLFRIPLPLPNDGLRAVNVYALLDDSGVALIDAGWAIPSARTQLEESLALLDRRPADIHHIFVTHVHRDHYTQAVRLRREFGSRVCLGEGERHTLDLTMAPDREPLQQNLAILRTYGAGRLADELARLIAAGPGLDQEHWALPDEWLSAGSLPVAGHTLEVIPTPGHTRGHVVFRDDARSLLFAGDHVLSTITPSIGFEPDPPADPLGDFLRSLAIMRALPDTWLLPAHGPTTDSVHVRVDALLAHHAARLDATEAAVASGAETGYDVAGTLKWTRREKDFATLDVWNQMLAVNETGAHLVVLALQGRAVAEMDGDLLRYRSA